MFKRVFAVLLAIFMVWKVLLPFLRNNKPAIEKMKQVQEDKQEWKGGTKELSPSVENSSGDGVSNELSATVEDKPGQEKAGVSINEASLEELLTISGVGDGLASKIHEHREKYGAFRDEKQLLIIPGIGEKKLEQMRDWFYI